MKDKLKARMNPAPPLGAAEQQQAKGENKEDQESVNVLEHPGFQ
jgi:hypothetical protein